MEDAVHINPLGWFTMREGGAEFVRGVGDPVGPAEHGRWPEPERLLAVLRVDPAVGEAPGGPLPGPPGLGPLVTAGDTTHVTGLTCLRPLPEALAEAAVALSDAFGPVVLWDDALVAVMVVRPGSTPSEALTRWRARSSPG